MNLRAAPYGRQSANKAKSIDEQVTAGIAVADEYGWTVPDTYQDGTSASRYARKGRDDWARCLADIGAGKFDILILWEASRGDRTLTTWSQLLDLCRERAVSIYVVSDERLYDPRRPRDWKTLASAGVDSAGESDLLSIRVKRGHAGAAAAGRPGHGRTPYGYRRTYDPASGAPVGQEPDEDTAPYVREIFKRLSSGESVSSVVADFNARGVPTAGAKRWYKTRIRDVATNRAYIGVRIHNGAEYPGTWEPLVSPDLFWRVQAVFSDPVRAKTRPGRTRHLLSFLAVCGVCGNRLEAVQRAYRCKDNGCVSISEAAADGLVTGLVLGRLAQPEVLSALYRLWEADDSDTVTARAEVAKLEDELSVWRRSAAKGETSPASLAAIEADLNTRIRAASRRAAVEAVPPQLREILAPGEDVRTRWDAAPLPARRRAIEFLAHVAVARASLPGSNVFEPARLLGSRWIGDDKSWAEHLSIED